MERLEINHVFKWGHEMKRKINGRQTGKGLQLLMFKENLVPSYEEELFAKKKEKKKQFRMSLIWSGKEDEEHAHLPLLSGSDQDM